jgi:hypothetical protein
MSAVAFRNYGLFHYFARTPPSSIPSARENAPKRADAPPSTPENHSQAGSSRRQLEAAADVFDRADSSSSDTSIALMI